MSTDLDWAEYSVNTNGMVAGKNVVCLSIRPSDSLRLQGHVCPVLSSPPQTRCSREGQGRVIQTQEYQPRVHRRLLHRLSRPFIGEGYHRRPCDGSASAERAACQSSYVSAVVGAVNFEPTHREKTGHRSLPGSMSAIECS